MCSAKWQSRAHASGEVTTRTSAIPISTSLSICAALTKHLRLSSLQTIEFISHSSGGWEVPDCGAASGEGPLLCHQVAQGRGEGGRQESRWGWNRP